MIMYLLIIAPFLLLGLWAQRRVGGNFEKWSQVRSSTGRTGAEVARVILDRNGLHAVEVRHTPGQLSDHYDPRSRTVNLSDGVHGQATVAAVSVAAHEVGHAIQHATRYAPLAARSALFPVAQFGSAAFMPLFFVGIMLLMAGSVLGHTAMLVAIGLFAFGVLFQLVTLPVEFDASRRARAQLRENALMPAGSAEAQGTDAVLNAAALTYVAAALAAVAQLAYFVWAYLLPRD